MQRCCRLGREVEIPQPVGLGVEGVGKENEKSRLPGDRIYLDQELQTSIFAFYLLNYFIVLNLVL